MATKATKSKIVTGMVRFSSLHVFDPIESSTGKSKYFATILIPKSATETIHKLKKSFEENIQANKAYFGGTIPDHLSGGIRDGDLESSLYAGYYFLVAESKEKPGVIDSDLNPITNRSAFYSGCYGRASITISPFKTAKGFGILTTLNNMMKLKDGVRLVE
jgi:hypothetical protein